MMRQLAINVSSYPSTCTDEWLPTVSTVGLPSKKAQVLSQSHAQIEAQIDHPREFPGYWWLFRMQHVSRYGARLAEERR